MGDAYSKWLEVYTMPATTSKHVIDVLRLLEKNQDVILAEKQDAQVYVPMCGKAADLKWFYDKGHRVVGVEFIEAVARSFFVDNSVPFDEAECPILKCKIFQTPDKRLRIFVCNVFDFNKSCAGTMDIVWDRGGLSSIDVELRDRYVTLMKSLLSPNFSYALWSTVYDDSTFNDFPTSMPEGVLRELFEDDVLPSCSGSTLYRLLKDMGFEKQKRNRNSFLIEREDIVEWRWRYLRAIGKQRAQNCKIYFQYGTWVNAGLTVDKVWTDSTIKSARQAFMSGLTTGLKVPSGKGERVIVTHAGSDTGFVSGCLDVFRGTKKGDYHDEMDSKRFEAWFLHLLDYIEPNIVIVIDSAPYHNRKAEAVPTTATTKGEIQQWLSSKNLDWTATMKKKDLLSIVAMVKDHYIKYKVDGMATDSHRTIAN
ncbi:uncharacterized protein ISCGN_012156 [Ixodes scapularis]